jgi:hypothetical protein
MAYRVNGLAENVSEFVSLEKVFPTEKFHELQTILLRKQEILTYSAICAMPEHGDIK